MEGRPTLRKLGGSSESVSTLNSEEFVLVAQQADGSNPSADEKPQFKSMSNGDEQLEKAMEEILNDNEKGLNTSETSSDVSVGDLSFSHAWNQPLHLALDPSGAEVSAVRPSTPSNEPPEEDSVLFNKLMYLGCTSISAPRNESEALRAMAALRTQSSVPLAITLYVPNIPEGSVRIINQSSSVEIASFPIYKVLFCVRGRDGTPEGDCFAFTESNRGSEAFQIHVFSCEIKEAFSRVTFM